MADAPTSLTIYSYQVGFGDCFLLRFAYGEAKARHVLIDFGTTGLPDDMARDHLVTIAKDIEALCGGHLEAIVATHRHADHISGFATRADGSGPGDVIRGLRVDLVLQPWTEAPDAPEDGELPETAEAQAVRGERKALGTMHALASHLVSMIEADSLRRVPLAVREQLDFIGRDNLSNPSAVETLMTVGDRHVYAHHGADSGLETVLPGVAVTVLGPPTLAQTESIRKQRARHPDEFWNLALQGARQDAELGETKGRLFPGHRVRLRSKLPRETRWIAERIDKARGDQFLSLVRALDRQMNNTSLILLFETGGKSFLFPGDAQWENWDYALQSPLAAKLAAVDLYKIGHHGSTNATPRSLWRTFRKLGAPGKPDRMTTLLSTMPGKHGDSEATAVPNHKLLDAAGEKTNLHSTHLFAPGELRREVTFPLGQE